MDRKKGGNVPHEANASESVRPDSIISAASARAARSAFFPCASITASVSVTGSPAARRADHSRQNRESAAAPWYGRRRMRRRSSRRRITVHPFSWRRSTASFSLSAAMTEEKGLPPSRKARYLYRFICLFRPILPDYRRELSSRRGRTAPAPQAARQPASWCACLSFPFPYNSPAAHPSRPG